MKDANHPATGNAGIASPLTIERHWPGVPEPSRCIAAAEPRNRSRRGASAGNSLSLGERVRVRGIRARFTCLRNSITEMRFT